MRWNECNVEIRTGHQRRKSIVLGLLRFLIFALLIPLARLLVPGVVDLEFPSQHLGSGHVVDREHRRALVHVHDESKAARRACLLVTGHVDVGDLTPLTEDRDHIAFGKVGVQATNVDVGRVWESARTTTCSYVMNSNQV